MTPENRRLAEDIFADCVELFNPELKMISQDMYTTIMEAMDKYSKLKVLHSLKSVENKIDLDIDIIHTVLKTEDTKNFTIEILNSVKDIISKQLNF